jgi:hypothetical protein
MSDESTGQQEPRIKLKLRTDKIPGSTPPTPGQPPSPESAAPEVPVSGGTPAGDNAAAATKIRLKPRIIIEPESPAETAAVETPAAETPVEAAPAADTPVETAPASEPPPPVETPALAAESPRPPAPQEATAPSLTPATPKPELPAEVLKIHEASQAPMLQPPPPAPTSRPPAPEPPPPAPRSRRPAILVTGAVLLVLLAVGYFRHQKMVAPPPPAQVAKIPRTSASEPKSAAAPAPAPARTPETIPGKAVQAARVAIAAVEENRVAPANEAANAAVAPPQPTPAPAPVAAVATAPNPAAPAAAPGPNARIRAYVEQIRIGGFRPGPPARLFIGGITFKEGDVVDQGLGVRFTGFDARAGELRFKDATGTEYRRRL